MNETALATTVLVSQPPEESQQNTHYSNPGIIEIIRDTTLNIQLLIQTLKNNVTG